MLSILSGKKGDKGYVVLSSVQVNMQPHVHLYIWPGYALFIGSPEVAGEHRHHVVQIVTGIQGCYRLLCAGKWYEGKVGLIAPDQLHRFENTNNAQALLIIDSESLAGQYLIKRQLQGAVFRQLDLSLPEALITKLQNCADALCRCSEARAACDDLIAAVCEGTEISTIPIEPRVQQALALLQQLPLKQVSTQVIAQQVYLSQSRLIHLFTQQVGISLRSYLLWLRLRDAVRFILRGETFTIAAHEAGFADSAHFSRVFRRTFGMTASFVLKNSQYIQAISCLE